MNLGQTGMKCMRYGVVVCLCMAFVYYHMSDEQTTAKEQDSFKVKKDGKVIKLNFSKKDDIKKLSDLQEQIQDEQPPLLVNNKHANQLIPIENYLKNKPHFYNNSKNINNKNKSTNKDIAVNSNDMETKGNKRKLRRGEQKVIDKQENNKNNNINISGMKDSEHRPSHKKSKDLNNTKDKDKKDKGNKDEDKKDEDKEAKENDNKHGMDVWNVNTEIKPKKKKQVNNYVNWPIALEPSDAQILKDIDYTKYNKEDEEFLRGYLPEMVHRARKVGQICSKHPDLMMTKTRVPLVWDTTHTPNIVWCPAFKVASTTWMTHFFRLAHFNDNNTDIMKLPEHLRDRMKYQVRYGGRHPVLYDLYPAPKDKQERQKIFKESIRFTIVRHPFSRILSSYRDKMLKMRPLPEYHHFRELQKEIIKKYRPTNTTETSPYPTFPEFIQHVIDSTENLKTLQEWKTKIKCWLTFWVGCNVCASDYNIIMKLETMVDDERFLVTLANLKEVKEHQEIWRHKIDGKSSVDLASQYYSQLTRSQILLLYERYKLDFEMFSYDIRDYLNYVQ